MENFPSIYRQEDAELSHMIAQIRHVLIHNTECLLQEPVPERPHHTWDQLFSEPRCMSGERRPLPTTEERFDRE